MSIAFYCIFAAALLPYIFVLIAKHDGTGAYNNHAPREYLEKQKGYLQRADWAHRNSFEIFPIFAAAVLVAHLSNIDSCWLDCLSVGFIVSRILFGIFYIADRPKARSAVWFVGLGIIIALFVLSGIS